MAFRQLGNPGVQFKARGPVGPFGPVFYTSQSGECDGGFVTPPLGDMRAVIWHVPRNLVVEQIGLFLDGTTAGGMYRMGIYASTEDPAPDRLLVDAGVIATNVAGYRVLTLATPLSLAAGQIVWLTSVPQVGAVARARALGIAGNFNLMWTLPINPTVFDPGGPMGYVAFTRSAIAGALPARFFVGSAPATWAKNARAPLVMVGVRTGGT